MSNNRKRIAILVAMMVLLCGGQAMSQTKVLGFQLGKSTYNEVKAKLPKGVKITSDDGKPGSYGGPELATKGTGYDINGLQSVEFDFDKKRTLAKVQMIMEEHRIKDITKILTSKYQPVRSQYPDAFRLFKANHDFVMLYSPWGNSFMVDYMTDTVYRQHMLEIRKTEEDKKKRLERAAEEEEEEEEAKF
jgi:hypothetical protein